MDPKRVLFDVESFLDRRTGRLSCFRRRLRLLLLCLAGRGMDNDGHRKTQLHYVVDQHFNVVHTGSFEFELREDGDIDCVMCGVLKPKSTCALPQCRRAIGFNQANRLCESANASSPPVEQTKLQRCDWHLRHTDVPDDADDDEIARCLLPDILAKERRLKIGQNACWWLHILRMRDSHGSIQSPPANSAS